MQQNDWLTYRGSLTARMEAVSGQPLSVTVIQQGMYATSTSEQIALNLSLRQWAWVREVELGFASKCWVTARTVVPYPTFCKHLGRLALLQEKPLGPVLFNKLGAVRVSMDVDQVSQVDWQNKSYDQDLWRRTSIFMIQDRPILVQEVFLPDNPIYEC